MKKADRDKYLGAIQGCLPSLYDVDAERPLADLGTDRAVISAKADQVREVLQGALKANLPAQLALFEYFQSEVHHKINTELSQRRRNCD